MDEVLEVTKEYFLLSDGRKFEHQFEINDEITIEEFQLLLNDSKDVIDNLMNKK